MIISVLRRIESLLDSFRPSELKVANFILENYKEVPNLTIKQLAKRAETSDAAVIRFLKTINIESYGSLKMYLYNEVESNISTDDILSEIDEDDSSEDIYRKVAAMSKKSIDDTMAYLSFSALDLAISKIKQAKRIYICGVGASAAVGNDLFLKFLRINLPVHFSMDVHVQLTSVVHSRQDDCVIIVSTSGKTREMLEVSKVCKNNKTPTILISQFGKTPLSEICDINLFVSSSETSHRIGTMGARIAELTLIDTLFTCLTKQGYEEYTDYIKETSHVMERLKLD